MEGKHKQTVNQGIRPPDKEKEQRTNKQMKEDHDPPKYNERVGKRKVETVETIIETNVKAKTNPPDHSHRNT